MHDALLRSPSAALIRHRPRTQRSFGVHCWPESHTPAHEREHGYTLLPLLPLLPPGVRLTRVDLKADRKAGTLIEQRAHLAPDTSRHTVDVLIKELRRMASAAGTTEPCHRFGCCVRPAAGKPGALTTALSAQHRGGGVVLVRQSACRAGAGTGPGAPAPPRLCRCAGNRRAQPAVSRHSSCTYSPLFLPGE